MSDNVQKTGAATNKPASRWSWKNLKGRFLIVSILFHILLAAVATYLVVQTFAPRKQTFKPGPKATANKAVEHKINMVKKQNSMSAPATQRITTKGPSKVVLPDMPTVPNVTPTTSTMGGMGTGGSGLGIGGAGAGVGTGGGVPPFGLREPGRGLPGKFYDLKQSKTGLPTDMASDGANMAYAQMIAKFIDRSMNEGVMGRYFVGPDLLYASQIYIPRINADEAPKAFNLEGKVQGRRWVVVYKGSVTPPESGRYHLVGGADDIIAVRFNGRMVLNNREKNEKFYRYGSTYGGGGVVGAAMDVKAGVSYPLDIVMGEMPGGWFCAYLLIEKEGVEYSKNDAGSPILPIFKFLASKTDRGGSLPEFAPDTSWSIWKAAPRTR